MAYVAARGGEEAVQRAEILFRALNGPVNKSVVRTIQQSLPYLVDRVMGEGSLYAPELAALALAQTGGDLYEAVLLLRAYRSTQPRLAYAEPIDDESMLTIRRISAAFKDIPGGQVLGPTLDYSHRLLRLDLLDDPTQTRATDNTSPSSAAGHQANTEEPVAAETAAPATYPRVADYQRLEGLVCPLNDDPTDPARLPDVTREPLLFPAPRAQRLQSLSRADTGGILALGYASMRGYGLTHPTVNELRLAYGDVRLRHPITGETFVAGRIRLSTAELVSPFPDGEARLGLGFCATMGWNEVKTIAGAILDMEMSKPDAHPAHAEEFVLYHTEPVESSGFCIHYQLPHYVTFNSSLESLRRVRENIMRSESAGLSEADTSPTAVAPEVPT